MSILGIYPQQGTVVIDPRRQLADFELEMVHAMARVQDKLEQQRAGIKRQINARLPLLQLPPEITSEIFSSYLADYNWNKIWESPLSLSETPLLFGRICSAWREIAWSTPGLWCSVELDLDWQMDPILVNQWLSRSRRLPLSICIAFPRDEYHPRVKAIMEAIANHSERWRNIYFDLPSFCYDYLEPVRDHVPNLQHITIGKSNEFPHFTMSSGMPQLQHLELWGPATFNLEFSIDNLIKLRMENECADRCLDMLHHCPRVIDCRFGGLLDAHDALRDTVADQLESLGLNFNHTHRASDFFDALTAPALRKLSIASILTFPHYSFISLIARSSCSLQALTLSSIETSDDQIIECLRATPSLEELSLTSTIITHKTLQSLTFSDRFNPELSGVLLPKLKVFKESCGRDLDFPVLVNFLRSRWDNIESTRTSSNTEPSSIVRLQSVSFNAYYCDVMPDAYQIAQLQRFVQEGMEITLTINRQCLLPAPTSL